MILLIGIPSEEPMARAIEAATDAGIDHVVVNQRDGAEAHFDLVFDDGAWSGRLEIGGRDFSPDDVTGIYSRMVEPTTMPPRPHDDDATHRRSRAAQLLLAEWIDDADCIVANRSADMASNGSKPWQARVLRQCGFATPDTLVTTDPAAAQRFIDRHGAVIAKSISGIRSIVTAVDPADDLHRVRALPTQFQHCVPGTDLRVHVVGEQVHTIRIESDAVDYRYAGRSGLEADLTVDELPDHVADRCRAAARALALPFCGIDLRVTPDGEYVCFEVNPSPAYSYYESLTDQPIARSLVEYLAGAQGASRRAA